jgi:acetyl-CoA acetyltransferase
VTVPAKTIDCQCASGLMSIATAAKQPIVNGMDIVTVKAVSGRVPMLKNGGFRRGTDVLAI